MGNNGSLSPTIGFTASAQLRLRATAPFDEQQRQSDAEGVGWKAEGRSALHGDVPALGLEQFGQGRVDELRVDGIHTAARKVTPHARDDA